MKKLPLIVLALAVVALVVCGQQAFASDVHQHWHIKAIPHQGGSLNTNPDIGGAPPATGTTGLYSVGAAFVQTAAYDGPNSDGLESWPCFGTGGSGTNANPDCSTLGDPAYPFPAGGGAFGTPQYAWYLAANTADAPLQPFGCASTTTASAADYCGQTNTWYEDWSNDSTDELLYIIEVTQNSSVLADSGTVDFGPNPYGGVVPAIDVVIYGDQNLGTQGVATGPNNGNCEANYNYPLLSAANPGGVYVVAAKKTCVNPVASSTISGAITVQEAKFAATTELGTPIYHHETTAAACGSVMSAPYSCYEVTWTVTHKLAQTWYIWLR